MSFVIKSTKSSRTKAWAWFAGLYLAGLVSVGTVSALRHLVIHWLM